MSRTYTETEVNWMISAAIEAAVDATITYVPPTEEEISASVFAELFKGQREEAIARGENPDRDEMLIRARGAGFEAAAKTREWHDDHRASLTPADAL